MKAKYLLYAMALVVLPSMMVSCGDDGADIDDNPTEKPGDNPSKPDLEPANEEWAPEKQQQYLEDVALEMNRKVRVDDFRNYVDLANYVNERYIEDSEWDNVENWAEDILDRLMGDIVNIKTEDDGWRKYIYNCYKSTILASNFNGQWTARNGKWNYANANDLQFIFNNQKGEQCVLKLATSGKVAKVHLFDVDDWTRDEWDERTNTPTEYYDRTQYTIGVPEKIEVTLTENGTTLISNTIDIDLASLSGEEFDLSKSRFSFASTTRFNNGYTIKTENVKYSATSASAKATVQKNNETLVTVTFSSDLKNIPAKTLTDWYDMDDDEIEDALTNSNAQSGIFALDFLGKVQVKGTIKDLHGLIDDMDDADDNQENEAAYKRAIGRANTRYEAFVYYNGGNFKQAWLSLEPFKDYEWSTGGQTYVEWGAEPIINFANGASYSFEEYFTEDAFKDLIDAFEDQEDTAEDMWD